MLNYALKKYYDADPCINIKPGSMDFGQYLVWDAVECYGKTAAMMQDAADFDFKECELQLKNIFLIIWRMARLSLKLLEPLLLNRL
ncbi:hypothetical protein [Legionella tunisiensis]|uniref:hypothetical protein n=1 Tax=Legionella tunisiensis TaxID=1034944 RepID=UPI00035C0F92|nr:hypothetical protein [Legionella tunisiensis]